jgi:hypothetical protein
MNLERNIEDALVAQIKLRTYIITNSIVVRRFDDKSTADGTGAVCVVKAFPKEHIQPNYNKYKIPVAVMAKAYSEADMEGDAIAGLYQDLSDYVNNDMTVAGLNTTITDAAVNIDGLFFPPSEFQRDADGFSVLANIAWIFATFTP